jgi:glutamine amidotransferase
MSKRVITVIDYGMGNLWSVKSALQYLGCKPVISDDPSEVAAADMLLLPGVGSYRKAMISLRKSGLDIAIKDAVLNKKLKILGICLGMQLMGTSSTEDGDTEGLGLIPASVGKFTSQEKGMLKTPHVGFDLVTSDPDFRLFQGLNNAAYFYFVHSYRMLPSGLNGKVATCKYGTDFLAAYEHGNIFATQFHPEKSQTNGLILLENFVNQ